MSNDGGPAFPSPTANQNQHGQLSVRDYFAAHAPMSNTLTELRAKDADEMDQQLTRAAKWAYRWADIMLTIRAAS